MTSVASQLIEEVTAHEQSDSLEDAREICADVTHFPNNLRIICGYGTSSGNGASVQIVATWSLTTVKTRRMSEDSQVFSLYFKSTFAKLYMICRPSSFCHFLLTNLSHKV